VNRGTRGALRPVRSMELRLSAGGHSKAPATGGNVKIGAADELNGGLGAQSGGEGRGVAATHAHGGEFVNAFGKRNELRDGAEGLALKGGIQRRYYDNLALIRPILAEVNEVWVKLALVDTDDVNDGQVDTARSD